MTTPPTTWTPEAARRDPREALEWAAQYGDTPFHSVMKIKLAATEAQRDAAVAACEAALSFIVNLPDQPANERFTPSETIRAAIALTRPANTGGGR